MEIKDIRDELTTKIKVIDPIGKKLKFNIDGEFMLIDGSGNVNEMRDQDEAADCTITMSKDTYLKLQRKEIKPLIATLKGQLKVKGDLGLARKNGVGNVFRAVGVDPFKLNAQKIISKAIKKADYKGAIPDNITVGLNTLIDSIEKERTRIHCWNAQNRYDHSSCPIA